jgi:glucan phosphoethanolaminetransferase (alkaline phosphatase superfamily)
MCRVSKKEVKIFPLLDLKNQKSEYLEPILDILKDKGFETKIIKTNYEFQKGANELLSIKVYNKYEETNNLP